MYQKQKNISLGASAFSANFFGPFLAGHKVVGLRIVANTGAVITIRAGFFSNFSNTTAITFAANGDFMSVGDLNISNAAGSLNLWLPINEIVTQNRPFFGFAVNTGAGGSFLGSLWLHA